MYYTEASLPAAPPTPQRPPPQAGPKKKRKEVITGSFAERQNQPSPAPTAASASPLQPEVKAADDGRRPAGVAGREAGAVERRRVGAGNGDSGVLGLAGGERGVFVDGLLDGVGVGGRRRDLRDGAEAVGVEARCRRVDADRRRLQRERLRLVEGAWCRCVLHAFLLGPAVRRAVDVFAGCCGHLAVEV